ncbi:hypothetical protein OF83DRAFT_1153676 [Amylostereum chailletii]|nr:hypothetical protein OF83DRAFT_1153676 [Amylostereum chailletii]
MSPRSQSKADPPLCISEQPLVHTPRNWAFYCAFVFAVLPLWSIPPLSWTFVVYSLYTGSLWSYSFRGLVFLSFALAEVFFSVYYYNLARFVSGPWPIPSGDIDELRTTFRRVLQAGLADIPEDGDITSRPGSPAEAIEQLEAHDHRAIDFRNSLRTWFGRVPWSHIHRDEMRAWLYWAIFNAHIPPPADIPHAHMKFLDESVDMVEKRSGTVLPKGSNPAAKPILLTLDPVNFAWRPLVWYIFVAVGNHALKHFLVTRQGLSVIHRDGIEYLIRVPKAWEASVGPSPVVFLHGLGLGLIQYYLFFGDLLGQTADRPLLIPLQPHISQNLFHSRFLTPLGRKATAQSMRALFIELGWTQDEEPREDLTDDDAAKRRGVTILSHSNGSFVHAWILKECPELVTRSCFVDPVTFCSWEGVMQALHLIMYYFVGSELGVTNVLQRHFDWSANSLYYEEIPNVRDPAKTKFFVGGQDAILSGPRVKKYLTSHGIRKGLRYDPTGRHGSALLGGSSGYDALISWLREPELCL